MRCTCCIIPPDVLERLSRDARLPDSSRQASADTVQIDRQMRKLRTENVELTRITGTLMGAAVALAPAPKIEVYDCKQRQTLPGAFIPNSGQSTDDTAKRVCVETQGVADFFSKVFGRNSIDGAG